MKHFFSSVPMDTQRFMALRSRNEVQLLFSCISLGTVMSMSAELDLRFQSFMDAWKEEHSSLPECELLLQLLRRL